MCQESPISDGESNNSYSSEGKDAGSALGTDYSQAETVPGDEHALESSKQKSTRDETVFSFLLQSQIPLIFGGLGLVATGYCLGNTLDSTFDTRCVNTTDATTDNATGLYLNNTFFGSISAAKAMITPLLGLKGNLEMNLASRLATSSHVGAMSTPGDLWRLVRANEGLAQAHAIFVSIIVGIVCLISQSFFTSQMSFNRITIFLSSVVSTASLSSLFIDACLVGIVVLATRFKFNPDNMSTPIAASVGDLATLILFRTIGQVQFESSEFSSKFPILSVIMLVIFVAIFPLAIYLALKHSSTKDAVFTSWVTLLIAALISCGGGFILKRASGSFPEYGILQPLFVGLTGNRCSIQASRLSSSLHVSHLKMGVLPKGTVSKSLNPMNVFFANDMNSKTALVLALTAIPTQMIFVTLALWINNRSHLLFQPLFLIAIFVGSSFLIFFFLYLCHVLVDVLWSLQLDPDYNAIPLLTSMCDLLGSLLLLLIFLSDKSPQIPKCKAL